MPKIPLTSDYTPEDKVVSFLRYLELDNGSAIRYHMHKSGKNVDIVTQVREITRGTASLDDRVQRSPQKQRKPHKGGPKDVEKQVKHVFQTYCAFRDRFGDLMGITGFHRMVRDCRLLDNRFGWGEVDVLFYAMDTAGGGRDDNKLMWEEFQALMNTLSKKLFPKLPPAEALLRLQTEHLIKFGKNAAQKHSQHEKLLTPKVMDVFVHYDTLLKSIYAFYATLDFPTYENSNWKAVKNTNRSISMNEFTKFLLNFEVIPHCVSKRDALDIFRAVNEGDDADEFQDELNFPEFIECLARLSLLVAEKVHDKLTETAATISEMAACKKYIARCTEHVKLHYKEAYDKRFSGSRSPEIDYEARAERQEQQKEEMEKEMEKHHQYYLQVERQRALHRLHNQHTATAAQLQRSGQHRNLLKSQHIMERKMLQSAPAALSVRMRDLSHYIQSDLQVKFLMDSSYKPVVPERETIGPELEMFEKRMKAHREGNAWGIPMGAGDLYRHVNTSSGLGSLRLPDLAASK